MAEIKREVQDKRKEMEEKDGVVLTLYKAGVNRDGGNGSALMEENG